MNTFTNEKILYQMIVGPRSINGNTGRLVACYSSISGYLKAVVDISGYGLSTAESFAAKRDHHMQESICLPEMKVRNWAEWKKLAK